MLADYFTKPHQGQLLNKFRDIIMGYKHIGTLDSGDSSLKEYV